MLLSILTDCLHLFFSSNAMPAHALGPLLYHPPASLSYFSNACIHTRPFEKLSLRRTTQMHGESASSPHFETKREMYEWLVKQVEYTLEGVNHKFTPQANLILSLSNVAALCFYEMNQYANKEATLHTLNVNWFGFYLLQAPGTLVLGPFQGRPACTTIHVGRGVCGTAVDAGRTLIVKDVHQFPGHIACDSASLSEVVVPIRTENGSIVGVIDVDSRLLDFFDTEDGNALEQIAALLSKHLEFPMTRALSSNPGLAFTNSTPIPSGVPLPGQTLTVDGPTKVTGIPFMTIDVPRPDKTEKMVGEWRFTTTRLDRIANQSELDELEKSLAFTAFPEIQFLENTLVVSVASGHRPILNFNLRDILRSAKAYYDGPKYQQEQGDLIIPVSGSWTNSTFAKHDPKIDWAWRNQFFGLGPSLKLAPLKEGSGINWELLKNQKLEIVFFDSFDFFEDDVHDNGMIRCSVKFRVMNEAFFILFRHFVRVDGHELWCRDVRYFHEFTTKRNDQPHIVVVEEVKKLKAIHAIEEVHNTPIDNLLANAETLRKEEFMIEF